MRCALPIVSQLADGRFDLIAGQGRSEEPRQDRRRGQRHEHELCSVSDGPRGHPHPEARRARTGRPAQAAGRRPVERAVCPLFQHPRRLYRRRQLGDQAGRLGAGLRGRAGQPRRRARLNEITAFHVSPKFYWWPVFPAALCYLVILFISLPACT